MNADQHLIEILGALVPNVRFESGGRSNSSTDYRIAAEVGAGAPKGVR